MAMEPVRRPDRRLTCLSASTLVKSLLQFRSLVRGCIIRLLIPAIFRPAVRNLFSPYDPHLSCGHPLPCSRAGNLLPRHFLTGLAGASPASMSREAVRTRWYSMLPELSSASFG